MELTLVAVRLLLGLAVLTLSAYAYYMYAQAIRRGEVKPVPITWIMLFVITLISLESQTALSLGLALVLTIARVIGAGVLMVLSIRYGQNAYRWSHVLVAAAVLAALAVRVGVENYTFVVCCTVLADFAATLPTIIGAWQRPETETPGPWLQDALASFLDACTVSKLSLGLLVYPLYLCGVCTMIAVIVLIGTARQVAASRQRSASTRLSIIVFVAGLTLAVKRHRSTLHLPHPIHLPAIAAHTRSEQYVERTDTGNVRDRRRTHILPGLWNLHLQSALG